MPALISRRRVEEFRRAFTGEINSLAALYRDAAADMLDVLADAAALAGQRARAAALLRQYQTILANLRDEAAAWIELNIPRAYDIGLEFADEGIRNIRRAGINLRRRDRAITGRRERDVFSQVHREAARAIVQEMLRTTDFAVAQIGRRVDDVFRREGILAVARGIAAGRARVEVSRELEERLRAAGRPVFVDRLGREWPLDRYAEMVARTTTREAMTQGTINRLREHGITLAQVSAHNAEDFCRYYENAIVSLDGPHPVYPPISAINGGPPFHPRCVHALTPFVERLATDEEKRRGIIAPDLLNKSPAELQQRFRKEFPGVARAAGRRTLASARGAARAQSVARARTAGKGAGTAARTMVALESPVRLVPASRLPAELAIREARAPTEREMDRVQRVFARLPAEPKSLFGEQQRIRIVVQEARGDFTYGQTCAFTPAGLRNDKVVRHELYHAALNQDLHGGSMLDVVAAYAAERQSWLPHSHDAFIRAGGGLWGAIEAAREEAAMLLTVYRRTPEAWAMAAAREFRRQGLGLEAAARRIGILRRALRWEA